MTHRLPGRLAGLTCLLASTLSAAPAAGTASVPAPLPAGRHRFLTFGPDQGFPSSAIHTLAQDADGFMWIGTENGLFRYDGSRTMRWGAAEGLPSDWVIRLLPNPEGGFWVGTSQGLARFRDGKALPVSVSGQVWKSQITSMDLDAEGRLVVAGIDKVLRQTGPDRLDPLPDWPGGPVAYLRAGRAKGSLFAVSGQTLVERLPNNTWRRLGPEDGLDFQPRAALEDGLGNLWVMGGRRLAVRAPGSARFEDRSAWMPGGLFSSAPACLDRDGSVWIPTLEGALRLRGDRHEVLGPAEGLPTRHVRGIFRDREGSLWLAAAHLHRQLGQGCLTAYTAEDGLPSDLVWSVMQDRDGTFWAGTDDGLGRLGPEGWKRVPGTEGMSILEVAQDGAGGLWLTNINGAPKRLRPDGRLEAVEGMGPGARAMYVRPEADGGAWFSLAGGQGVRRWDPKTHQLTPIAQVHPEVAALAPRVLVRDPAGRAWVAGKTGVAVQTPGGWRIATAAEGMKAAQVRGLAFLADGSAWAWYVEPHGMSRVALVDGRLEVLEHLDAAHGLASSLVYAVAQGRDGAVWVTTDRGVDRVGQGRIRHFGLGEGLLSEDCDANALAVDRDGDVWVGTSNGLARIRAAQLPPVSEAPAPRILRFDEGKSAHLAPFGPLGPVRHGDASVEFRFSSPTYLNERDLQYQVRLLGLEEAWHSTEIRQARYAALPGGRYRFEVRAARPGGAYGPVAAMDFSVLPPWWRTWWFYGLEALAAGGAVWLAMRLRLRRLQEAKAALEAVVAERTRDLQEANRALEEQSFTDPLTGLRNRRFLSMSIREDLARVQRAARPDRRESSTGNDDLVFFIVDLDKFKSVNDTYGHQAGDEVLVQLSETLRGSMRESDTVVRWGGEEFVLLARDTNREEARVLAERVRAAVEAHPFTLSDGTVLRCTCSIGFAPYPFLLDSPEWASWEKVVDLADHGLYLVKTNGRNGWVGFEAGPHLDLEQDLARLAAQLPEAVAQRQLKVLPCRPLALGSGKEKGA